METEILSASSWKDSSDDAHQTLRREDLEVEGASSWQQHWRRGTNGDQRDGKVDGVGSVLLEEFHHPLFGAQDYAVIGKRLR